MKKKVRKDKAKHKNMIRKQQIARINSEKEIKEINEDDCGVSDELFDRMKDKMIELNDGIKNKLIRDSSLERMSDILVEYAKPFMDTIDCGNREEYEKALMLSIMLWNCSIIGEKHNDHKMVKKMLKPIMPDADSKMVMSYMLERKRQMYPNNKRMIINYELTDTPDGLHLSVASTVTQ